MVNAIAWKWRPLVVYRRGRNDLTVTQLLRKWRQSMMSAASGVVEGGKAHRSHCNAPAPVPFCRITARLARARRRSPDAEEVMF